MKKLLLVSLCFLWLGIAHVFAQSRTVTGTVIAKEDGGPIPGVSVKVKGTSLGVITGADGHYSINVPETGKVLVFGFIGYGTIEKPITGSVVNATLTVATKQLGEVLVTGALGLTRTRNQQAYAAQEIAGDETSKTRGSNFVDGLSGKVAGLEIRQNNGIGGSSNVVLRGNKSMFGDNQALFVVDGVPFNNNSLSTAGQARGTGGYDYGNPASDINPDDIESVTVLKGASASALYGSRGANGVILITTKKAKRGLGVVINSSISEGSIDKTTFPTYQTQYGGGYGPSYGDNDPSGNASPFWWRVLPFTGSNALQRVAPMDADGSLGAAFDPNLLVYQSDAFDPYSPNYHKATPWVAHANAVTFFQTGVSTNNSVFITSGGDNSSFKLGYTRNDENGVMPNSNVLRNSINFASTYTIAPKLTAGAAINYDRVDGKGRYGSGYQADNILNSFRQWMETNVDYQEQKSRYFDSGGKNETWNYTSETNLSAIFWDNPYFIRYQNYETDTRNRYFGNVNLNYKVLPWLNVLGRVTVDNYSQLEEERRQVGSTGVSNYTRRNINFNEVNYDLIASADKNISADFNLKGLLGTNIRKTNIGQIAAATNGGLVVPGIYSLTNSVSAVLAPTESDSRRENDGIFAGATISYKNMLVLDGTIRRDVSSTLPVANNSYFYPAVNLGFTFSELLKNLTWLSYGKVRLNYAQVGNDASPYGVFDTYAFGTQFGSALTATVSTTKNNLFLKPEINKSYEAGLEMQFFNSRLGFDATYYSSKLINQLIPVTVSTATGYNSFNLNAGTVQNQGIELAVNGMPVKIKDFSWKIAVNYTRNRNKVLELFKDAQGNSAQNLSLASYQGGVSLNATLNQPLGMLRGKDFVYLNGQKEINPATGYYLQTTTTNNNIGNVNPDWIGGINNTFTVGDFSLSFLIDIRKGGSVFSLDTYYGMDTGLYPETAGTNAKGKPTRDPVASGGGVLFPGVTPTGQPNTTYADNTGNSYDSAFGYSNNPQAGFIYDASYVKLREAILSYSLPKVVLSKFVRGAFKGIDFGVSGRNLWIIHKNVPYSDPEEGLSYGNLQGYQSGAFPTTRTFTFNVKLTF